MKPKNYLLFLSVAFTVYSSGASAQVIKTFAGTGTLGYSGDNSLAVNADMNSCTGVAVDGAGNVYIADKGNNVVRKVTPSGIMTTFAGNDTAGYSGDGAAATAAKLNQPYSLATDVAGNLYIADRGNNAIRIVSRSGIINSYAGTGAAGYSGDNGLASAATLYEPQGIAIDSTGNLYIADAGNNVIREVSTIGVITTIAGNGSAGYTGDNAAATAATLNSPAGVAVDAFGDVYIADQLNNVVREVVASTGLIKTVAGDGVAGSSGDGDAATGARLFFPAGVSLDQFRNLYIADQGNNNIRVVDSSGTISLFAGRHTAGYSGDNGAPTSAELSSPIGVTADGWGRVYIADYNNNVVRVVTQGPTAVANTNVLSQGIKIYPNPTAGMLTVEMPVATSGGSITVTDVLGNVIITTVAKGQATELNLRNLPAGSYIVNVVTGNKTYTNKVEVLQ